MNSLFIYFGPWTWFIIAVALLLLELFVPGVFFIWLGIAAVATGLIDLLVPLNWQLELVVFAILSLLFLVVGRPIVMKRINQETDQPNLNKRSQAFVGKRYRLKEPIVSGRGNLTINDTQWRIRGNDCPAGSWVTITAVDGLELLVEKNND